MTRHPSLQRLALSSAEISLTQAHSSAFQTRWQDLLSSEMRQTNPLSCFCFSSGYSNLCLVFESFRKQTLSTSSLEGVCYFQSSNNLNSYIWSPLLFDRNYASSNYAIRATICATVNTNLHVIASPLLIFVRPVMDSSFLDEDDDKYDLDPYPSKALEFV